MAVGRTSLAIGAFTDPALALAFVKALSQPESYREVLERLTERTERVRKRQAEERAHRLNKQKGKKK
jgi:23S rRNA maturation mini-RNase III